MYDYLLNEAKLKASERTDFGIPSKKKYPMPDEAHVRAAIRMFNHCDPEDEAELARNIKKHMKKYGVNDIEVGENNRFSKYYKKPVQEGMQERYLNKDDLIYFAALDEYKKEFKKVFGENESLGKRRNENWYEIGYLRIKDAKMATKIFDVYKARFESIYGALVEKGFDVVFEDDDNGYIIRYNANTFGDNVINNINNILSESTNIIQEASTKYTKQYKDFNEFCSNIDTPEEVSAWFFANNVRWYIYDKKEREKMLKDKKINNDGDLPIIWPEEILRTKTAVCFDHAIFMHYFCENKKINNAILVIHVAISIRLSKPISTGHVVCMYEKKNEGWFIFNYLLNMGSILGPYKSKEEAVKQYKKWYIDYTEIYIKVAIHDKKSSMILIPKIERSDVFIIDKPNQFEVLDHMYGDKYATQSEFAKRIPGFSEWENKFDSKNFYWIEELIYNLKITKKIKQMAESTNIAQETIEESGWVIPRRDKKYNTYEHCNSIFESLSDQEKEWVAPHGYKDVPCYYRQVAYNKSKTLPVGFIDIYRVSQKGIDNPGENVAKIILAVRKDYRKQGLAKALIKNAVHRFKDSDIDVLRYNVVDGNDASKELAIKCGFIYNFHSDKHKVTSFMITNGRKMQEAIGEESNDIYFEEEPETGIASIAEEVESMIQELSGGGGPMIGMEINDQSVTTYNPGMFIISYGSKKDADPNDDIATSSGYAVANDLRSKYILVKRKNKVVREDYVEFLTDRKISIYEYTGDVSKWYEMLKSIDEGKSDGEFYTALTGRELLTDDQIYFDEHFKYYNPFKTKIENGMTLDLNKEYSLVEGREFLLPVMDDEMLKLQERVNNINPNYTIKEGPKGYFIVSEAEGKCSALPLSKHDIEEYVR